MMGDPILVLAWLVVAHLAADFVLQTGRVARLKSSRGAEAVVGLLAHGVIVAGCVAPVGFAYGERGWWFVAVTGVSHVAIDRTKVSLTRRAAAAALREAHAQHQGPQPPDHLGRAWTPWPAALFLADQAAHLAVAGGGWAVLLATAPLLGGWTTAVEGWIAGWDRTAVHAIVSVAVVLVALAIVNVRAASLFVGILVRPVHVAGDGDQARGRRAAAAVTATALAAAAASPPRSLMRAWSIRLGPLAGRITAEPDVGVPLAMADTPGSSTPPLGTRARVGTTIGVLERILIVVFVLTGSEAAIGFVVAAKTLARFRLLDDRDFAEYYLLGTLASVSVAIISALIGRAALGALLG